MRSLLGKWVVINTVICIGDVCVFHVQHEQESVNEMMTMLMGKLTKMVETVVTQHDGVEVCAHSSHQCCSGTLGK